MLKEEAIKKTEGPCIILAGAGTGKTHSIVEKTKYLIKSGKFNPQEIVCITFSNEAANTLISRIRKFSTTEKMPIIKTFHSFSSDLLRIYGDKIGIPTKFNILTPEDAKILLHNSLKVSPTNCHKYISLIGTAKDLGISTEKFETLLSVSLEKYKNIDLEKRLENLQFELQTLYLRKTDDKNVLLEKIKEIKDLTSKKNFLNCWKAYEKIKKIKELLDYSDLNSKALELLENNPEIAENYRYIIVDEFQDTNKIQLDFLKYLAINKSITVVGDLNQSIYRFRGAYRKNFDEFKSFFNVQEKDILNLDKSFRSSNKILRIAHKLISKNYLNPKDSFVVKNFKEHEGDKINVFELKNSKEEARKVSELVEKEIKEGKTPEDICILYRTHQYGRIIKQALELRKIQYCAVSSSSLLKQKSVKTIIDYLTILDKLKRKDKGGEQAWWDLVYQHNFPESDLIKIGKYIKENKDKDNISAKLLLDLPNLSFSDPGKLESKILIERIKLMIPYLNQSLDELARQVIHFSCIIKDNKTNAEKEQQLNLNKFYELVINHSNLYESDLFQFLKYLETINQLQIDIETAKIEEKGVRLMTLHATKGLEFNTVIVSNMAQKRFPIEKTNNNSLIPLTLSPEFSDLGEEDILENEKKQQISEERRLCYVAFTRTKENLFLTYALEYNKKKHFPSQFLNEIEYKKNTDISFVKDNNDLYIPEIVEVQQAIDFSTLIKREDFEGSLVSFIRKNNTQNNITNKITFSPSSLFLFSECQKKYEYKYVFNMPEQKSPNWEVMRLGSFVHIVLEKGVKNNYNSLKQFIDLMLDLHQTDNWESIDLEEAEHLIKVFFERNKSKYSKYSKTEQQLNTEIEGLKFTGFADRIDFNPDGIEIVDYKTGASNITPKNRNWQLGYYAIASENLGKVKKITLDMLKQEKPLEFELDDNGNAKGCYSSKIDFNIFDVKKELLETARQILEAHKTGFKPCPLEKNCDFCDEYVYG